MIALVALALAQAAQAQNYDARPGSPTARDMYVACYLYVNRTEVPREGNGTAPIYAAARCALSGLQAITHREGRRDPPGQTFCLPHTPDVDSDPARAMALAYMDHYERVWVRQPSVDGTVAYLIAMIEKWPCAPAPAR